MTNYLPNDAKPKYAYDGLLRAKGYDKDQYEGISIIKTHDEHDKKVWCPDCKHTMRLVEELDCYICNNMKCGTILQIGLGDTPLHEEQVLHVSNDPYAPDTDKPTFVHINPEYPEEYEDFGKQVFKTAEEAMQEGRRFKRGGQKAKPRR